MNNLQWTYLYPGQTIGTYILTSDGRVFSGKRSNFLKPQEKGFCYLYYKITFIGEKKPRNISAYKMLKQYFPQSLEDESNYRNIKKWREIIGNEEK